MDPPANSVASLGYTFYRNEKGLFECPVVDCKSRFKQPESMRYHISRYHVFAQAPSVPPQSPIDPSPRPTTSEKPNLAQTAFWNSGILSTTGGTNEQTKETPIPVPQTRRTSTSGITKTPSPVAQHQPLSVPPDTMPQDQGWSENSITWPSATAALLKNLIIEHTLFSEPRTTVDYTKLQSIFREFYEKVEFPAYKPPFEDERLWALFKAKVTAIQNEMLKTGEVYKTNSGYMLSKFPPNALQISNPPVPAPVSTVQVVSTPPVTPIIPSEQDFHILKLWSSMDSAAQARHLYLMLHTAKDPQSLFLQCEKFCADYGRKESTPKMVSEPPKEPSQDRRSISGPLPLGTRKPTETPPPPHTPRVTTDLKTLLEARLREASVKRQRAEEEAEMANGTAKRLKSEPT